MSGVSVLILTRNEALDLPGCLQSVAWSDDVHVLDSFSDDATAVLARESGAHVTQRTFDDYASQRNAGLKLPFAHEWILLLDADERIPPALAAEMKQFIREASAVVAAARMRRRDIWRGRWLRHAQISPLYIRLVRRGRVHYERQVNEVLVVDGEVHDLRCSFDHFPFSKGIGHWIAKHNTYSRMEADLIFRGAESKPSLSTALFASDFHERRRHQKTFFYRLPGRPLVKFLYMMVMRRAFLDGWPGVHYATLQAIYEYLIVLKTQELRDGASAAATPSEERSEVLGIAPTGPSGSGEAS
jgi:glycosyltransferase involved in cell wall biosynthesis